MSGFVFVSLSINLVLGVLARGAPPTPSPHALLKQITTAHQQVVSLELVIDTADDLSGLSSEVTADANSSKTSQWADPLAGKRLTIWRRLNNKYDGIGSWRIETTNLFLNGPHSITTSVEVQSAIARGFAASLIASNALITKPGPLSTEEAIGARLARNSTLDQQASTNGYPSLVRWSTTMLAAAPDLVLLDPEPVASTHTLSSSSFGISLTFDRASYEVSETRVNVAGSIDQVWTFEGRLPTALFPARHPAIIRSGSSTANGPVVASTVYIVRSVTVSPTFPASIFDPGTLAKKYYDYFSREPCDHDAKPLSDSAPVSGAAPAAPAKSAQELTSMSNWSLSATAILRAAGIAMVLAAALLWWRKSRT